MATTAASACRLVVNTCNGGAAKDWDYYF